MNVRRILFASACFFVLSEDSREGVNPPDGFDFDITQEELASMRALGLVIGRSPRTVIRFINTYRLFKAMKIPPGAGGWTEEGTEGYDFLAYHVPIMILLSIQVGFPDIAVRLFEHIGEALDDDDSQRLGALITAWEKELPTREAERNKWRKVMAALTSVVDLYGDTTMLTEFTVVGAFNPWLLATSRFVFQEWLPGAGRRV